MITETFWLGSRKRKGFKDMGWCPECKRPVTLNSKGNTSRHGFKRDRGMRKSWFGFDLGIEQEDGPPCMGSGRRGMDNKEFSDYMDKLLENQK